MATIFDGPGSDIDFYTEPHSRNGAKIAILLEELGLTYRLHKVDATKDVHKEAWFLTLNPKGHVLAMTDIHSDGSKVRLFESGSIMQYLLEAYDKDNFLSYPAGSPEAIEVNNWLFFQTSRVGPVHAEADHFSNQAPQKIPYSISRYSNEILRLYSVLEAHLAKAKSTYMVGDKCTIADIALFPWVADADAVSIDIERFFRLTEWQDRMMQRPAVKKGMNI